MKYEMRISSKEMKQKYFILIFICVITSALAMDSYCKFKLINNLFLLIIKANFGYDF